MQSPEFTLLGDHSLLHEHEMQRRRTNLEERRVLGDEAHQRRGAEMDLLGDTRTARQFDCYNGVQLKRGRGYDHAHGDQRRRL